LGVQYEKPSPQLHNDLFVKFSRDFDDEHRDAARTQMELEVLFALLSRDPNFPIDVPACYFSDFHHESGTGILITQRIPYDINGVEPHYPKSLDYLMPDQLEHYQSLIRALARLAGTHKAGKLQDTVEQYFPFDPAKLAVSQRAAHTPEQISQRVERYCTFARTYPQILPEHLRSEEFLTRFQDQAPRFQAVVAAANRILQSEPDMIALCHWNAHVDNAWFWKGEDGHIHCGLMDWGNVSQMNLAMAIWGCISAAELWIWDDHLDDLLALFVDEFEKCGGPVIDVSTLKLHLVIYVANMGLEWMLDSPRMIEKRAPQVADAVDRFDPIIQRSERARSQLLIMSAFLNLWYKEDMESVIRYMESFS